MRPTAPPFSDLVELASERMGGQVVACSDDFFAPATSLIRASEPEFDPDAYTDRGKLMDGWESRRRRTPGHDWCLLELGLAGVVHGIDLDTAFFMGNHAPFASVEGCVAPQGASAEQLWAATWSPLIPQAPLQRGAHNLFSVRAPQRVTHLRLRMYPDGGIARLRAYGVADAGADDGVLDLAAAALGGRPVACSDMFFSPMVNLIAPGRAENMGGGWETRRRRQGDRDWIVLALGVPGAVERVELDTSFFKGNYPHRASLEGLWWPDAPDADLLEHGVWRPLLEPVRLRADDVAMFPVAAEPVSHVRLNIFRCGGVHRLRLWGHAARPDPGADPLLVSLAGQSARELQATLLRCCGSTRWAERLAARGPFGSRAQLLGEAESVWWSLSEADWREAFSHHPRIGEDPEQLRARFGATAAWAEGEQAGVAGASDEVLARLAEGNRSYAERFGYTFLVCATGLSAAEMLSRLEQRLEETPEDELRIAAGEQARITRIRLEKLA